MAKRPDPATMTNVEDLKQLRKNAIRLLDNDLANQCFRRICEIEGVDFDDPVERRFQEALAAVEQCLHDKHGKRVPASYTRRKHARVGAVQTLTDWALKKSETEGFRMLVENGMSDLTGEYIVHEFPDAFPTEAVEAARARLKLHGVLN